MDGTGCDLSGRLPDREESSKNLEKQTKIKCSLRTLADSVKL